jgi:hypothetical protein
MMRDVKIVADVTDKNGRLFPMQAFTAYPVELLSVMLVPNNDPEDPSPSELVLALRLPGMEMV